MQLNNGIGARQIKDVIEEHPEIGRILDKYAIGCIKCSIGTCLLQDVVSVYMLGDAMEEQIEKEINGYLAGPGKL
jgi:hypothetical protein